MRLIPAALCLLLAVSCGVGGAASAPSPRPSPSPSPSPSPTPTVAPLTLDTVIAALKALGVPIGVAIVYTADTDPDHLLGKPNQYLARAAWQDTRVAPAATAPELSSGGVIEVFATAADLATRVASLGPARSATEQDYASKQMPTLVRFSGAMTPDEVAQYVGIAKTVYPDLAPI